MSDKSAEELDRELGNLVNKLQTFGRELDPIAQGQQDLHAKAKDRYDNFLTTLKGLGSAAASAGKAMNDIGGEGAGKYAGAVKEGTNALSGFANQFGKVGFVVGKVIDAFGSLAAGALKQNEALNKTYNTLAAFGDLDNQSFAKLGKDVRRAGFSMDQNSEKYAAAIQAVAPELINLGGTVAAGRKKIVDVFQTTLGATEKQLERFGMNSEEAFSRTGSYIKQLAASNGLKNKTESELNAQSVRYMETLVGLSVITGQTRDEAEKRMQEQQNDLRFQMHLSKLRASGQDEEADNLIATMAVLPKEMADGAKSLIVNQGRIVDDMGAKTYQLLGNEGIGAIVSAAKSKAGDLPVALADMMNKHSGIIDKRFQQLGNNVMFGNDTMNDFNMNIDSWNYKNRGAAIKAEDVQNQLNKIHEDGANGDKDANTRRKQTERALRNAFEELEYKISQYLLPAIDKITAGILKMGKSFADMIYWITSHIPGMDTVDFRDLFVQFNNMTDVTKELNKRSKEQIKLQKELDELKKEEVENEKFIAQQHELKKRGSKEYDVKGHAAALMRRGEYEGRKSKLEGQMRESEEASGRARTQGAVFQSQAATETATGSLDGLTIKKGDVHRDGSALDPKLVEIAKQVQAGLPGFKYFSSFNDKFHKDSSSQHAKGRAFDLALDHFPSKEEGQKIVDQIKAMGADHVIDEYNNPSSKATAGHIHAQLKGKTQGIFNGPESGYWLQAHGEEMLLNKKGFNDLLGKIHTPDFGQAGPGKPNSDDGLGDAVSKMQMPDLSKSNNNVGQIMAEMFGPLIEKVETLIELQRTNNGTQEEILTYTKA